MALEARNEGIRNLINEFHMNATATLGADHGQGVDLNFDGKQRTITTFLVFVEVVCVLGIWVERKVDRRLTALSLLGCYKSNSCLTGAEFSQRLMILAFFRCRSGHPK